MQTTSFSVRRMQVSLLLCLAILIHISSSMHAEEDASGGEWIQLFNGKDLKGWVPKIRYHKLGENYGNTFRVEDGILKVGYDPKAYPEFKETFGHLFYEKPFSNYVLRAEYRFVGKQVNGGPGWAIRNSGLMLQGELPETMEVDQDFPASIEVQLLGGDGKNKRTTANICTPGTHISLDGTLTKRHCTNSSSKTYHGEQWVTVEVEVRGHDSLICRMDGETVFEMTHPVLDDGDPHSKVLIDANGGEIRIFGGSISLQSESHPVEYRKVEIKLLKD
ncbi:MAG: DUF1080 domain-containing protein [Verrucomicrobia bacterium]|nr:DUF1080 domain-containing protein [Verrucomicrobiota bacterium]